MRVRIDGEIRELDETIDLKKNLRHSIAVVVDRLVIRDGRQIGRASCRERV